MLKWTTFSFLWMAGLALGDFIGTVLHMSGSRWVFFGGMWMLACIGTKDFIEGYQSKKRNPPPTGQKPPPPANPPARGQRSSYRSAKSLIDDENAKLRAERVEPAAAPLSESGCAYRWDTDDVRVQTCVRHQGWLDVVSEWASRARAAEAKVSMLKGCSE